MIRKRKNFSRPKKAFEKSRMEEENLLLKKYGLKNKREVWKTIAKVDYYRRRAKALAKSSSEEQEVLFNKLRALGLKTNSITDVLALKTEDIFERRLPTVVSRKGFASTPQQARQMVTHKKVRINNNIVDSPSFLVPVADENAITVQQKARPAKEAASESPAQVSAEENK